MRSRCSPEIRVREGGQGTSPASSPQHAAEGSVLVVDDNSVMRQLFRRALEQAQFKVMEAEGGMRALALLERGRPGLVVLDLMMAGMDGRALADAARARYPQLRVLFSSGYAEHAIARHGVLAEGVEFIAKPYSLQALAQKVRDVLDR